VWRCPLAASLSSEAAATDWPGIFVKSGKPAVRGNHGVDEWRYYPGGPGSVAGENARVQLADRLSSPRRAGETAEQRDAADEGRLEAGGSTMVGKVIVEQGEVVRPSQLIASVGPTWRRIMTRRMVGAIVCLALAWGLLLPACMPASWGAGALLHPSRRPLTTPRPSSARDVSFESGGLKLKGWLFQGSGVRRGTVVYLHGSADNRASGVYIAERFLQRGFNALAYDSRAHGESEGSACTYGYYEKQDLQKAIDLLDARPVVVLGVSLGGAVALQAAAEDPRIAVVVAVASFSDLRTVAIERAPLIASRANIDAAFRLAEQQAHFGVDEASPLSAAPRIRVPVLLIHGQDDRETPPTHSQRLFAALGSEKRLLLVPSAGHNDTLRPDTWVQIDAWLDSVLAKMERGGPTRS
jgi:uncharacterized protein